MICFLQFFFVKRSNNFFAFKTTNIHYWLKITTVQRTVFLTFLITKTSPDQLGTWFLAKMLLYFDILTWLPSLNFGIFLLFSLLKPIYMLSFTSASFFLMVLWDMVLYLWTMSSNLSIYTFFDIEVLYYIFVLINLSARTDFPPLCVEYSSILLCWKNDFIDLS